MNNRGVSPIIATIMLVSIVVAMMGMVTIWVNSQSQQAMDTEGERRERIADRENELLELITVDSTSLTILNNGTSDSVIAYLLINETYIQNAEFQDPSTAVVEVGAFTVIIPTDPAVLTNVGLVEIGTELGNTFLFTAPSAVIQVESTFFSYGNKLVVLDGTASTDADGHIVSWEWDLNGNGDFTDPEDGTGQRISVTFSSGSHTVTLRVTDETGLTSTTTIVLQIPP